MEIGELRKQLALDHMKGLQKTIDRYSHLDEYYILVTCVKDFDLEAKAREIDIDSNLVYLKNTFQVITNKFLTENDMDIFDLQMLGSICYAVNNRSGELMRLWVSPLDIPQTRMVEQEGDPVIEVIESTASSIPIVY